MSKPSALTRDAAPPSARQTDAPAKKFPTGQDVADTIDNFIKGGRVDKKLEKLGTRAPLVQTANAQFVHVPMARVSADPHQPRKTFPQAELEELAETIRQKGVIEPILVRPDPKCHNPAIAMFHIIAGERRYKAAKIAGLETVPAIVRHNVTDRQALEIQLIENLHREGLAPLEEAAAYAEMQKQFGKTTAQIAEHIGKSVRYVQARLQLLKLNPAVTGELQKGTIAVDTALRLAALKPKQRDRALDEIRLENTTTGRPVPVRAADAIIAPPPPKPQTSASAPPQWRVNRSGAREWKLTRGNSRYIEHIVRDLREAAAWLKVQGADLSRCLVGHLQEPLSEKIGGSIAPASAPSHPASPDLAHRINDGKKIKFPKGANAVRLTYEKKTILLKDDIDTAKNVGVPVRVEFGKVPFQSRGRPNRGSFETV